MIKFLSSALLLVVALQPALASADSSRTLPKRDNQFTWNYLQGGLEFGGRASPRVRGSSLFAEGSYVLEHHLFVRGRLSYVDGEVRPGAAGFRRPWPDVDVWRASGGLGFKTPLQQGLDLQLTGDMVAVRAKASGLPGDTDLGAALGGGLRYRLQPQTELAGGVFVEHVDRTEAGVYGEFVQTVNDRYSVGGRLTVGDSSGLLAVFLRFR